MDVVRFSPLLEKETVMKATSSPFVLFYYVVFQYSFEELEFNLDEKEKKIESLHFVNFDLYKD